MDNREAKFILSAYRPGGQDARDPRFSEALEQARRDPILQRWFDESVAFDRVITEKLCAAAVPADLRENILAGVKVSRAPRWKNRLRKWAIAAAVILAAILGSSIWYSMRSTHLAGWQNAALDVISSLGRQQSSFDAQSHDAGELLAWLRANGMPAAERLSDNIGKLTSLGCKTFSWNGTLVSVTCFMRPGGGLIHLVTTAATPATDRLAKAKPTLLRQGEWTTATWREGDMIYMLALEGSPDQLRPYLS
jgi:hypothetical protein